MDITAINARANEKSKKNNKVTYLGKALAISIAYSANCGGTGTLIGTTVNPVLQRHANE